MNTKTFERCFLTLTAAAFLVAPMCAQNAERRATFTGGGGNDAGKCTIEVYVDGSADVEIRGDRGVLRTLSGQPAQWRRFECSGPMPENPGDFRFSGVDGRGKQELVQDPSRGRGAAVVRIQDSSGGAEGYTFDLVWRGAGFVSSPTGQPLGGRDRGGSPTDATRACQDAVRERADQQYGLRSIDFRDLNADDNQGRNDRIVGSFDVRATTTATRTVSRARWTWPMAECIAWRSLMRRWPIATPYATMRPPHASVRRNSGSGAMDTGTCNSAR